VEKGEKEGRVGRGEEKRGKKWNKTAVRTKHVDRSGRGRRGRDGREWGGEGKKGKGWKWEGGEGSEVEARWRGGRGRNV